jgi:hypothetical protein
VMASVSRSQCGYIRMAEQVQAGALPPHGAEPPPRALTGSSHSIIGLLVLLLQPPLPVVFNALGVALPA